MKPRLLIMFLCIAPTVSWANCTSGNCISGWLLENAALQGPVSIASETAAPESNPLQGYTPDFTSSYPRVYLPQEGCRVRRCELDLLRGTVSAECDSNRVFQVTHAPNDRNQDGYYQACIRVSLDPKEQCSTVYVTTGWAAEGVNGWTLHIGDSISNNGYNGDSSHQSNDAEVQILNTRFRFWSNDLGGPDNHWINLTDISGSSATFEISDQLFKYEFDRPAISGGIDTGFQQSGFALGGQPDTQGPVNHDIFVCGNRTQGSAHRNGSGLHSLEIVVSD